MHSASLCSGGPVCYSLNHRVPNMSEVDEEKGAAAVNASLSGGEPEPYQHLRAKAPEGVRTFGVFKLRGRHDSLPQ